MGEPTPPGDVTRTSPREIVTTVGRLNLTDQQQVLAYAGLNQDRNATTSYVINRTTGAIQRSFHTDPKDDEAVIAAFRQSPKDFLADCRANLMRMGKDQNLQPARREKRQHRYIDNYLDMIVKLDRAAFQPSSVVQKGIPEYIPDGLSDMGSSEETDPDLRSREKIRVDKKQIFDQTRSLFYKLLSLDPDASSTSVKTEMVQEVARYVNEQMHYDYKGEAVQDPDMSVNLGHFMKKQLAVCRHHALVTQVLLQSLGLTSRLMKSNVSFDGDRAGAHANNLVRINNRWFLLDSTNPEHSRTSGETVFLKPVPQLHIDLNANKYKWEFQTGSHTRTYTSRSNMNYRIRDNQKDPSIT